MLQAYSTGAGYADCFFSEVGSGASLASFIEAFYTTPLFKVERLLLGVFASRPATDADARELAQGTTEKFSAWKVEGRDTSQLLLADFTGRTRSWLMVEPILNETNGKTGTRLYFGSAVVARKDKNTGKETVGVGFHTLLGFHKLYSRLLLRSALARLSSGQ